MSKLLSIIPEEENPADYEGIHLAANIILKKPTHKVITVILATTLRRY